MRQGIDSLSGRADAPVALPAGATLIEDEYAEQYRRCAVYVVLAALLFFVVYSGLAYLRYKTFVYGGRFDLGNMVQAVYNTAHGHFLETTAADMSAGQVSRLGSHVDPILALFALPWLVWPSPVMLLVLQSAIVATIAWPAYRLGTRVCGDPRFGAVLAGALLLYPALGFAVLDELHPVVLSAPLLLFAFLYLEEDRWKTALPFLLLAALCKEEVPLVLAAMGLYFALRKRSWRPLLLTAAALAYFALAVWVVIPHYNAAGTPFADRYADYGDSTGQMARTALLHPEDAAADLVQPSNLSYWRDMLWPFIFSPLLSPLTLLVAGPELALNALSAKVSQRSIQLHYTGAEIPFFFAATVLGIMRLHRRIRSRAPTVTPFRLAVAVLAACLAANYLLGPLPFPTPGAAFHSSAYRSSRLAATIDHAVAEIPDGVTVSVTNNVGSVLSARQRVMTFPAYDGAAYVLVNLNKPDVFDRWDPEGYETAVRTLLEDSRYQRVFDQDGVIVFERVDEDQG